MGTVSHDGELRAGLAAAAKAAAVIIAVGMLAVGAGKAGYTSETAIAASPGHALAAAPAGIAGRIRAGRTARRDVLRFLRRQVVANRGLTVTSSTPPSTRAAPAS